MYLPAKNRFREQNLYCEIRISAMDKLIRHDLFCSIKVNEFIAIFIFLFIYLFVCKQTGALY